MGWHGVAASAIMELNSLFERASGVGPGSNRGHGPGSNRGAGSLSNKGPTMAVGPGSNRGQAQAEAQVPGAVPAASAGSGTQWGLWRAYPNPTAADSGNEETRPDEDV